MERKTRMAIKDIKMSAELDEKVKNALSSRTDITSLYALKRINNLEREVRFLNAYCNNLTLKQTKKGKS